VTSIRFESEYAPLWSELETQLDRIERGGPKLSRYDPRARQGQPAPVDAAHLAALYRGCCEHLALAQARAYPIRLTQRLQSLTYRAHRLIYRRQDYGLARLRRLLLVEIPQSVRAQRDYLLAAALLFLLPALLVGGATYRDPQFALHLMDAQQLAQFRDMYGDGPTALGMPRSAQADWSMFGYYTMNNIDVGFQCFASGLFAGLGSAFFVAYNGAFSGAIGGYLTGNGEAMNFYSFIVTHSAFELTAIALAGAAGLRVGFALIAPGRQTRLGSVKQAAAEAVVLMYAVFAFLLVAAAIEAFWSSARWVAPAVKFSAGAAAWAVVVAYLGWQGRPSSKPVATADGEQREG
jgi:uncharacterized membrane protein SpoIIM required for sporulation